MKIPFSRRFLQAISDLHGFIEHNTAGTYYFQFKTRTKARMVILSGGVDPYVFNMAGGSGILWIGKIRFAPGIYKIIVGPAKTDVYDYYMSDSILKDNNDESLLDVMLGTVSQNLEVVPGSVEQEFTMNTPEGNAGGASPYNGYGKGADKGVHNATGGYFSIEW